MILEVSYCIKWAFHLFFYLTQLLLYQNVQSTEKCTEPVFRNCVLKTIRRDFRKVMMSPLYSLCPQSCSQSCSSTAVVSKTPVELMLKHSAQAYENWPIGADLGFQKRDLNETSTKTEHLDRRWLGAATMDSMRKIVCFLNIKACEHFLVDTQNKYMNLKMTQVFIATMNGVWIYVEWLIDIKLSIAHVLVYLSESDWY